MNQQIVPYKPLPPIPKGRAGKGNPQKKKGGKKTNKNKSRSFAGSGSMAVSAPVQQGYVQRYTRPQFSGNRGTSLVVRHREYIGDVLSSTVFAVQKYDLNPGLDQVFPWLSRIAGQYESYLIESFKLIYEPQCATTTPGTVMVAIDYDAVDNSPTSKAQVMAYESAVRSPAWSACIFHSNPADLHKRKTYFVRSGSTSVTTRNTYDTGSIYICRQGQAGVGTPIGELYVEYAVRLMTPQMGDVFSGGALYRTWFGASNTSPFGTTNGNVSTVTSSIGTTSSVTTVTFNQQFSGLLDLSVIGTGLTTPTLTGTGERTLISSFDSTGIQYANIWNIKVDAGETIIINITNTTITGTQLFLTQCPYPVI